MTGQQQEPPRFTLAMLPRSHSSRPVYYSCKGPATYRWLLLKSTDWFLHIYVFLTQSFHLFLSILTPNQNHSDRSGNGDAELSIDFYRAFLLTIWAYIYWPITLPHLRQFYSLAPVIYFCELSLANKIAGSTPNAALESAKSLMLKQFSIVTFYQ